MSSVGRGRITVLIADDHPVVRQGLAVLLEVQDDIELVAEASRLDVAKPSALTMQHCTGCAPA